MGLRFDITIRGFDLLGQRMAHASNEAKHAMAIQAAKDTEQYVPALTKSLANRTRVEGDTIIYPGPYAHYLYVGKLFVDPNTGSPIGLKHPKRKISKSGSEWRGG